MADSDFRGISDRSENSQIGESQLEENNQIDENEIDH